MMIPYKYCKEALNQQNNKWNHMDLHPKPNRVANQQITQ